MICEECDSHIDELCPDCELCEDCCICRKVIEPVLDIDDEDDLSRTLN